MNHGLATNAPISRHRSQRGSLILVVLCLLAVLGIALASFLAVGNQSMKLSNRSYRTNMSAQLAEMGVEEALRAFNNNDWSNWTSNPANVTSGSWTLDTTNKRATRTITFNAGKLGQGATGTVIIRIDNYDANQLDSAWNNATTYRVNDVVGYSGTWYRCVRAHSNQTPAGIANMDYWVPDPMPAPLWNSTTSYRAQDVVYYASDNKWYRCILAPTANEAPNNTTYWTWISKITVGGGLAQNFEVNFDTDGWWYYSGGWVKTPPATPIVSWCWRQSNAYAFNDMVLYGNPGVWYRCKSPHTSSGTILPTDPTYWENALTGMWGWSSSLNYKLGDVVYSGSSMYRCILANINKTPASNPACWSASPNFSQDWDSGKQYKQYDTVRYNGVWYLSLLSTNINRNPVTATSYWIGADTTTTSYQWNSTTAYSIGNYRCYGGVWYKCLSAGANKSPNNSNYWTASWVNGWGVTTGAPVIYAEGQVTLPDGSPVIKTQLRTSIAPAPLFPNAIAASTTLSANSGGTVDSFDSTASTPSSTQYTGQVDTSTNFSAVVAAGDSSGTAITLASTTVKGYLAAPSSSTSPFAPLFSSGGTVKGFTSPGSPNIDLTHVSRSPYIPQFDTLPSGSGSVTANWATLHKGTQLTLSTTTNLGTPGNTTPSRYYYNGNLTIGTGTIQYLNINGPVILYINGDLFITASGSIGRINVSSTGSAEIHVAGAFKADSGGEGVRSYTYNPKTFVVICDTASTADHYYSEGANPLYGVVYVPYTTSTNGYYNNNTLTNIYGAVSAKKVTYSGANMNIHYDTALRYALIPGVDQPWAVSEWRELTDPNERAVLP